LGAAASLQAVHIETILVVDVNSIKFLVVDNVHKAGRELFFLSKAIIPTVIVVSC
jgi:hypothetical protein